MANLCYVLAITFRYPANGNNRYEALSLVVAFPQFVVETDEGYSS